MLKRLLLLYLFPIYIHAQNTIGLPDIINYSKKIYNGGLQNWDIKQDKKGIIYIANNEGLLTYDGKYWKSYALPNKTIVRSLAISDENKIYVGGQDEVGYFSSSANGVLQYHSVRELIPEKERALGDIWDIVLYKKDAFFRSNNKIIRIAENQTVTTYKAPMEWSYLGIANDILLAHDYRSGLLQFKNGNWEPIQNINILPTNDPVTAVLSINKDSIYVSTLKNGIYLLKNNTLSPVSNQGFSNISKQRIYAATMVNEHQMALATSNSGVYITDEVGNIIQQFSTKEQLQNNNVLSIFLDNQRNLWLGLNNGIDFIAYDSPIKHINAFQQNATGYAAIVHNNELFTGTSSGVFKIPLQKISDLSFSKGIFSPIANISGQTWNIAEINNKLLVGHHDGAFVITNNIAKNISNSNTGYWNFIPNGNVFPAKQIISGNYKGLTFFNFQNGQFIPSGNVPAFVESSRFVAIDKNDNIWVSHPYHGVTKIVPSLSGTYNLVNFTTKQGLPSQLENHVFKIKNEVVFATEKGIYQYNESTNTFSPSTYYQNILGSQSIRYLKEDTDGNIWFMHEKSLGVIDFSDKAPKVVYIPELTNKLLSGFEMVYPYNTNNIFIAAESGFYHINYEKYKKTTPQLHVQVREVRIVDAKDSLLFGGYFNISNAEPVQSDKEKPSIANNWQTIHIKFASPFYAQQSTLEYAYRLKGFSNNWSEWSTKTEKEYTNLPSGTYTFEVKVRNNLGNESQSGTYTFTILPPWYQTSFAYFLYLTLLLFGIFWLYKWQIKKFHEQQNKHMEEQKKLQYLHQLEIDKAENELIKLRNEKLQAEVDFKNSELATSAMHLVQKGEHISKIKAELVQIMKTLNNDKATAELKKMIKELGEADKMDKDWEHFTQHFDKVHSDFVIKLKEKHPGITGNDIKLSAYLRMNLSTKEIAQLMNISVRGVEIGRYRLRKKLGITTDISLFDYLTDIK